eukprot:881664-Pelagomonas_calceolata.AAC.3
MAAGLFLTETMKEKKRYTGSERKKEGKKTRKNAWSKPDCKYKDQSMQGRELPRLQSLFGVIGKGEAYTLA